MDEKQITVDRHLPAPAIAAILRQLADELEGKAPNEQAPPPWQLHGFNKLKMKLIRDEGGQLVLRFKIKNGDAPPAAPASSAFIDIAEREYRPFKNQFKATFAELTALADRGGLPSAELAGRFWDQARRLTAFPGFGDPHYEEFWQACQALGARVEANDRAGFAAQVAAITELKRRCHRQFK